MRDFCGQSIKYALFLLGFYFVVPAVAQNCEWFSGGDESFYRYIEDRLSFFRQGPISRDPINGETISFEIFLDDSGYADSTHLGPCFNAELANNMRLILATLPRLNNGVNLGCPKAARRIYLVTVKQTAYGIEVDPATQYSGNYPASQKFKWGIVILAVVGLCLVVFK